MIKNYLFLKLIRYYASQNRANQGGVLPLLIGLGLIMTVVGLTMIGRSSDDQKSAISQKQSELLPIGNKKANLRNKFDNQVMKAKHQGFSLIEVLIGMMVITTFTLTALQAFVIAVAFKVKAAQSTEATNQIQTQVEKVKFKGLPSELDTDEPSELCNAEDETKGYGNKLKNKLPTNPDKVELEYLEDETKFAPIEEIDDSYGRDIRILKHAEVKDNDPDILQLEYVAVFEDEDDNPSTDEKDLVTKLETEVIPDAALEECN